MLNVAEYNKLICHDPCTDYVAQPKNNYFELGNIFESEWQYIRSPLLINSFCCWIFYPDHGVIIILCEECLECVPGRERLPRWSDGSRLISGTGWQSPAPANLDTRAPSQVWPGSNMRWGTGHEEFYFLWLFILWRWHHRLVKASRQYPDTKAEGSGFMNGS